MDSNYSNPRPEPRLRDTLRDDIHFPNHWQTFRKELKDLREFYIDEEKKKRLDSMTPIQRAFHLTGWILKGMLMRLTPLRRVLLLFGIVLSLLAGPQITFQHVRIDFTNFTLPGAALILLVLMLELKDKLLARDELVAGQKVQRSLMPERSPYVSGWRYGLALADVSGKGLQAALIMAKLQAVLKGLAPDYESIDNLVAKLNVIFHRDGLPNSFASLVYAEISPLKGKVRYVNAGHLPPVLLTADGLTETLKGDPALGLLSSTTYTLRESELQSGDVFLVYSDGITEASNERGEFFGTERFLKRLGALRGRAPEEIGRILLGEIEFFVKDAAPNDDLSLIIIQRQ